MNVREFYESRELVLGRIFSDLQAETQSLSPKLDPPEVFNNHLVLEFFTIAYAYASDFDKNGRLIIGEFGGVIPQNPENGKRILAVSGPSLEKVLYGIKMLKSDKENASLFVEKKIDMPLEKVNGAIVVNGNRNVSHYDFVTCAVRENSLDMLKTNLSLLLGAQGYNMLSNKHLPGEQYVFGVPKNDKIFKILKKVGTENIPERIRLLSSVKNFIVPDDFIVGMHITYKNSTVEAAPIISERTEKIHHKFFNEAEIFCKPSEIYVIGESDAYGRPIGIARKSIFDPA